jgi:hypothetical protein
MSGKVLLMTEEYTDPSGNTAQFQAFAHRPEEPAPTKRAPVWAIVSVAVVVIVVAAVVAYFAMS